MSLWALVFRLGFSHLETNLQINSSSVSGVERAVLLQLIDKLRDTEGNVTVHRGMLTFEDGGQIDVNPKSDGEVFTGACAEEILEIDLQSIVGDYDTPDTVQEWRWIAQNASFAHANNGQDGVWEFVLNLSRSFEDVPQSLQPLIGQARECGMSYIVFHQGT